MSRYTVPLHDRFSPLNAKLYLGWDKGLQTFFATIVDESGEDDVFFLELGVSPSEITKPETLAEKLKNWADLSDALILKLREDKNTSTALTPLQKQTIEMMKKASRQQTFNMLRENGITVIGADSPYRLTPQYMTIHDGAPGLALCNYKTPDGQTIVAPALPTDLDMDLEEFSLILMPATEETPVMSSAAPYSAIIVETGKKRVYIGSSICDAERKLALDIVSEFPELAIPQNSEITPTAIRQVIDAYSQKESVTVRQSTTNVALENMTTEDVSKSISLCLIGDESPEEYKLQMDYGTSLGLCIRDIQSRVQATNKATAFEIRTQIGENYDNLWADGDAPKQYPCMKLALNDLNKHISDIEEIILRGTKPSFAGKPKFRIYAIDNTGAQTWVCQK